MPLQVLDILFRGMRPGDSFVIEFETGRFKGMDAWEAIHAAKGIPNPDETREQYQRRKDAAKESKAKIDPRSQKVRWQRDAPSVLGMGTPRPRQKWCRRCCLCAPLRRVLQRLHCGEAPLT